jgi:hypothetical protein
MRAVALVLVLASCQRHPSWGNNPITCHISGVKVGAIESFEIDDRQRGVRFRVAPDVWKGSFLSERNGRFVLETNEIGVSEIAVEEHPESFLVRLTYRQTMSDGGIRDFDESLSCQPISQR